MTMYRISTLFIKTSLIYLAISTVLGILIIVGPGYSFMHSHFTLIGWVSFFIFGVSYEIVPRFTGKHLFSEKLAYVHLWSANIGLIGLSISYPFMRMAMLRGLDYYTAQITVIVFGLLEAISIFIFIFNIWKSMRE